jgi:glycosyltransferase involved in cell wall biosynthesis
MPFRNEAADLPRSLGSLARQLLPRERWRLVAVDNGSTDGGGELVREFCAGHGIACDVVREDRPSIPRALNRAIERVRAGEIVARLDAHTVYDPGYLRSIDEAFARLGPEVWCVGGAPSFAPPADFSRALHASLLESPMGVGPAAYRDNHGVEKPVTTIYLGAWRPGILQRLGGFDEAWLANEDAELNARIHEAGGVVYRIDARSERIVTRGALAAARQWARYGFWRARTLRRHPTALRLRHVAPPIALLVGGGLAVSPARPLLVPLYLAYAAATVAARPPRQSWIVTAATVAYFPLVQCGYALGLLAGSLAGRPRPTVGARTR